jgi:hypothetical protein
MAGSCCCAAYEIRFAPRPPAKPSLLRTRLLLQGQHIHLRQPRDDHEGLVLTTIRSRVPYYCVAILDLMICAPPEAKEYVRGFCNRVRPRI